MYWRLINISFSKNFLANKNLLNDRINRVTNEDRERFSQEKKWTTQHNNCNNGRKMVFCVMAICNSLVFYVFFVICLNERVCAHIYTNTCVSVCVYWHEWHDNHKWSIRITIPIMLECSCNNGNSCISHQRYEWWWK